MSGTPTSVPRSAGALTSEGALNLSAILMYALRMGLVFRRTFSMLCFGVLVLAACSSAGVDETRPRSSNELDCAAVIDVIEKPPETYEVTLDVIALPGPDVQHFLGRTDPESGLRFAKMGLLVRPGRSLTITVGQEQAPDIRVAWGTIDPPAEQFVVPSCKGDEEWQVYAGGIWVSESTCVTLTIATDGQTSSIQLPINADCS